MINISREKGQLRAGMVDQRWLEGGFLCTSLKVTGAQIEAEAGKNDLVKAQPSWVCGPQILSLLNKSNSRMPKTKSI